MKIVLLLGDQLSQSISSLQELRKEDACILMAEVGVEASYVPHHKQKIALIFSAMRHFAAELRAAGWRVHYHSYDETRPALSLLQVAAECLRQHGGTELVITECGESRLHEEMVEGWERELGVPLRILADTRFVCSKAEFAGWAQGRKQLRMEYFYREMRARTGLLMQDGAPVGGQWNFDAENRKSYRGEVAIPVRPVFEYDAVDREVFALVECCFSAHPGQLAKFNWPTTRAQALLALDAFVERQLPWFGDYQDAMQQGQHFLFHSLLSTSLNCGLLTPLEVCEAAEQAWRHGAAPLNAVEGFIRQVIGWREYVRGVYWLKMPQYAQQNALGNTRALPGFYWSGNTGMACMKACFDNTFEHAYAHHIQRLMVTGNFALLAGIEPRLICEWYLAVYADAYDWVELPNTLGMVMHADGGLLASKPYAASGSYIQCMSNYCGGCRYKVKTAVDANSCPFNSLYWHFIARHGEQFRSNPRMAMIYRSYAGMDEDRKAALQARAEYLLAHIEEL